MTHDLWCKVVFQHWGLARGTSVDFSTTLNKDCLEVTSNFLTFFILIAWLKTWHFVPYKSLTDTFVIFSSKTFPGKIMRVTLENTRTILSEYKTESKRVPIVDRSGDPHHLWDAFPFQFVGGYRRHLPDFSFISFFQPAKPWLFEFKAFHCDSGPINQRRMFVRDAKLKRIHNKILHLILFQGLQTTKCNISSSSV